MQGVSTFAILVLFVCTQWAGSAQIIQRCTLVTDGIQVGDTVLEEQDYITEDEGADVRIYVEERPVVNGLNVVGSSLLFCDDKIDDVHIELAQDKSSYLVHRELNNVIDSFYVMKLVLSVEPVPYKKLEALRKRPSQLKRPHY